MAKIVDVVGSLAFRAAHALGFLVAPVLTSAGYLAVLLAVTFAAGGNNQLLPPIVLWVVSMILVLVALVVAQAAIVLPIALVAARVPNRYARILPYLPAPAGAVGVLVATAGKHYNLLDDYLVIAVFVVGVPLTIMARATLTMLTRERPSNVARHRIARLIPRLSDTAFCIALALSTVIPGLLLDAVTDRSIVSRILKTPMPRSARKFECKDYGFTDVMVYCYFEVDAADYNSLLKSFAFTVSSANGRSHTSNPPAGPDFHYAEIFRANLEKDRNGGSIMLLTDSAHRRVALSLYIE